MTEGNIRVTERHKRISQTSSHLGNRRQTQWKGDSSMREARSGKAVSDPLILLEVSQPNAPVCCVDMSF